MTLVNLFTVTVFVSIVFTTLAGVTFVVEHLLNPAGDRHG